MSEFTDWLHGAAVALAGPLIKMILIFIYTNFAETQEHYVKATLTLEAK